MTTFTSNFLTHLIKQAILDASKVDIWNHLNK